MAPLPEDGMLEQRLGYTFQRRELLVRALTHSSASPEAASASAGEASPSGTGNNETFEFLGDAVLELLASEYLLEAFPSWTEGQLSKSRARIVNARSLEMAARRLELGRHLRLGRGEEKTGGREKPALLADAFEALVAAIYLDSGLAPAREALTKFLFAYEIGLCGERLADSDRKSALQELLQGRGQAPAEYRVAGESGPAHRKVFRVEVWSRGECLASGEGSTKKEAEQRAAGLALGKLEQTEARP